MVLVLVSFNKIGVIHCNIIYIIFIYIYIQIHIEDICEQWTGLADLKNSIQADICVCKTYVKLCPS